MQWGRPVEVHGAGGLGEATIETGGVGDELVDLDAVPHRGHEQLGAREVAGAGVAVHPDQAAVRSVQHPHEPLEGPVDEGRARPVDEDGFRRSDRLLEPVDGVGGVTVDDDGGRRGVSGHASRIVTASVGSMTTRATTPAAGDTPVGRVPGPDGDRRAHLDLTGDGWTLTSPWRRPLRGAWAQAGALVDGLSRLDHVHALSVEAEPSGPAPDAGTTAALADFVTRAVARGTFVVGDLPAVVARRVHAVVPGAAHGRPGDLAFDVAAVRQRRQVLAPLVHHELTPTISVLLATRRPQLLGAITAMIRAQTLPPHEVVIAVHGGDPDALPGPDLGDIGVTVVAAPGDRSLGHALQLAADAADGQLLTKMDDDDHYGPDHLLDLAIARHVSGAPVVGKSSTVVHVESLDTTVRRVIGTPESAVHRVAGGTILVGADELRDLGGWADVPRAVDSALMRAATAAGAMIYRPHDIGYVYVRHAGDGHTWSADAGHFLANAREQWLGLLRHPDFGT